MKPVSFDGQNSVFAKDQPPYLPLPAHRDRDGKITTCWSLSLRERFAVLIYGRVWAQQLTFNKPLQPQRLCTDKPLLP